MKKRKYSIRRALLNEGVTWKTDRYSDPEDFPSIPVKDISFVFGGYISSFDGKAGCDGDDMGRWESRYWEDDKTADDVMGDVLWRMNRWFSQNPKASALVKEKLASTDVKRGVLKAALPIFADSAKEGDPAGYMMYKGKISPADLVAQKIQWRKRIEDWGNEAEQSFQKWLESKGLSATVIGGTGKPDVVCLGFKFEVGSGEKKRLSMGSVKGRVTKTVQPRRQAFEKNSPRGLGTTIESEGILEIWRASGYDYLVKPGFGGWAIFSLSDASRNPPAKLSKLIFNGKLPQKLDATACYRTIPVQLNGSWTIKYDSLDWTKATTYKEK